MEKYTDLFDNAYDRYSMIPTNIKEFKDSVLKEAIWQYKTLKPELKSQLLKYADEYYNKQIINQLYKKPDKKYKLFNNSNVQIPNAVHEADLVELAYDTNTHRYCLTVVDLASHYRYAWPLKRKFQNDVIEALKNIYKVSLLRYPKVMLTDKGSEFSKAFTNNLTVHGTKHIIMMPSFHLQSVESFNKVLAVEMYKQLSYNELMNGKYDNEWEIYLNAVLLKLNDRKNYKTKLTPNEAIKLEDVDQKIKIFPQDLCDMYYSPGSMVRRLLNKEEYQRLDKDKIEITHKRRATDPLWSLKVYTVFNVIFKPGQLSMHQIMDDDENVFPYKYTYWQLQLLGAQN